jgi:hypothetical protein
MPNLDCTSKEISIQSTIVPVRKSLVQWLTESRFGISKFGITTVRFMVLPPFVKNAGGRCERNTMIDWDSIVRYKTERGALGSKTGYPRLVSFTRVSGTNESRRVFRGCQNQLFFVRL